MNYSRSYWYNFLPFYHMGVRSNYQFSDKFGINYWVTNGTQQTEEFNGFKDQMGGVVLQPCKNINWTVNYYFGQEHPDTTFYLYSRRRYRTRPHCREFRSYQSRVHPREDFISSTVM